MKYSNILVPFNVILWNTAAMRRKTCCFKVCLQNYIYHKLFTDPFRKYSLITIIIYRFIRQKFTTIIITVALSTAIRIPSRRCLAVTGASRNEESYRKLGVIKENTTLVHHGLDFFRKKVLIIIMNPPRAFLAEV